MILPPLARIVPLAPLLLGFKWYSVLQLVWDNNTTSVLTKKVFSVSLQLTLTWFHRRNGIGDPKGEVVGDRVGRVWSCPGRATTFWWTFWRSWANTTVRMSHVRHPFGPKETLPPWHVAAGGQSNAFDTSSRQKKERATKGSKLNLYSTMFCQEGFRDRHASTCRQHDFIFNWKKGRIVDALMKGVTVATILSSTRTSTLFLFCFNLTSALCKVSEDLWWQN